MPEGFTFMISGTPATTWRPPRGPAPELMHRMGHSSMRAALIYQHATSERDREIASGMDKRIAAAQGKAGQGGRLRESGPGKGGPEEAGEEDKEDEAPQGRRGPG
jgi:hypothetical protein